MAQGKHASEVLTIAGEAIREPVPGSGRIRRGEQLPRAPKAWPWWMRRPPAQGEAAVSGYEPLRCSACSRIIGAYEPLVVRVRGEDRASSLAAEPELPLDGAEHLHLACAQASQPPPQTAEVVPLRGAPAANTPVLPPRATARPSTARGGVP